MLRLSRGFQLLLILFALAKPGALSAEGLGVDEASTLSGSGVHALATIYAAAASNRDISTAYDDLASTDVYVGGSDSVQTVLFVKGYDHAAKCAYVYDRNRNGARRVDLRNVDDIEPVGTRITGAAARALATAYDAWATGSVPILDKANFESERFLIHVYRFTSPRTRGPAFWIQYTPSVPVRVGTGCSVQQNYGVDVRSWKVIVEGTIC